MALSRDNDYAMYLYTCNRCRGCATGPSPELLPVCPSYMKFGYFSYCGGGKGYVAQGVIEGKVKPDAETLEIAMNCLMCGACAHACPPGFDINAFIRDLRDHLVKQGIYFNDSHKAVMDGLARRGNPWGRKLGPSEFPAFDGKQDVLIWAGCHERLNDKLAPGVKKILDAAGVSYGVLPDEPCCGAPMLDLGAKDAFEEQAGKVLAAIEQSGAERMLILCPHCASTMMADYYEVGDLEVDPVTLPALIAELIEEEKIKLDQGEPVKATYHDPCRLARWLEEVDPPREILAAVPGLELVEMERHGEWGWCCGAGGWSERIAPELSNYAASERMAEAAATGAELVVAGCSYCSRRLGKKSRKKQKVVHIVDLVADRLAAP